MDLLDRLLGHDEWTTTQLLLRCHALSAAQRQQKFDAGHQSLDETFTHMIANVRIWSDLMAERPVRREPIVTESVDVLLAQWQRHYGEFAALARRLADEERWDDTYVDVLDEPPRRKSFGGTIGHVITHNMHHRSELLHIMARLGLEDLPEGDLLSWESEARRPK